MRGKGDGGRSDGMAALIPQADLLEGLPSVPPQKGTSWRDRCWMHAQLQLRVSASCRAWGALTPGLGTLAPSPSSMHSPHPKVRDL